MIPQQGGAPFGGDKTSEIHSRAVILPYFGGGYSGTGPGGDEDVRPTPPEYNIPIHCDSSNIGDMFGGRAAYGSAVSMSMVQAGGLDLDMYGLR